MKLDKCASISTLARPINADCFSVFTLRADLAAFKVFADFRQGSMIGHKSRTFRADESLLRDLLRSDVVRSGLLELYGPNDDLFDHLSVYTEHRVAFVINYISTEYAVSFMLLRGSEVSLDRIVQLHDSPVHHFRSKEDLRD